MKLSSALFLVIGSIFLISLPCYVSYYWYGSYLKNRTIDPKYNITTIVQTGPEAKAFETSYLAEVMGLSIDKPINLFNFDVKKAEEKLSKIPLIKEVHVRKEKPGAIYVDYEIREPVARLLDYENSVVDAEGYIFPLAPLFASQKLPDLFLGLSPSETNLLKSKEITLASECLEKLSAYKDSFKVLKLDVSKAFDPSSGKREIVLQIEDELSLPFKEKQIHCIFPKFLRLSPKDFDKNLSNFVTLLNKMQSDYKKQLEFDEKTPDTLKFVPKTIDLRIEKMAFLN